ncbi:VCBS repeat-containing protein [Candidatus Binatia bacterium]|nr:VCBS repeat-containing protein [Candidatus Binatia bacterium]
MRKPWCWAVVDNWSLLTHLAGAVLVASVIGAPAGAAPLFGDPRYYQVGTSPVGLVAGDFDGSPGLDLATANEDNTVSVLANDSAGVFRRGSPLGLDERYTPTSIAAGAFNAEPITDLVFGAIDTDDLSGVAVLYQSRQPYRYNARRLAMGFFPTCIAAGNLNDDAILDIATCSVEEDGQGLVALARGNPDFSYSSAQGVGLGALVPSRLQPAIVDNDGETRPDLVVLSSTGNAVQVLYGRGDLTFDPPAPVGDVAEPTAVAVGRFDSDALPDIAVASRRDGSVYVFRQISPRNFAEPVRYTAGALPIDIVAADLTGDGKLDLAVANNLSNDVSILAGQGDATFQPLETVRVGNGPVALVVADFNGDGKLDFATPNQDDQTFGPDAQSVTVVLNGTTPAFTPTPVPTVTRTPRRSPTPTASFTATRTPTPAGPGDNNCDGVRNHLDVQTVIARIFDGVSGCLTRAVTAADVPWTIQRLRS